MFVLDQLKLDTIYLFLLYKTCELTLIKKYKTIVCIYIIKYISSDSTTSKPICIYRFMYSNIYNTYIFKEYLKLLSSS